MSEEAFYFDHVGDGFDGYMDIEELRAHLYGLLDFPESLEVENEGEPSWDPEAFAEMLGERKSVDPSAAEGAEEGAGGDRAVERVGSGIAEGEITEWTCFSCGAKLTQAHEGDYFHTEADSQCTEVIPVPTSLLQPSPWTKAPSGAPGRD